MKTSRRFFLIQSKQPAVAIIGGNSSINYLIGRYTERIGCSISVMPVSTPVEKIYKIKPVAVIFASVENLENLQALAAELTNCDIPIIVCSSMVDQTRTRELGADYCLLHPFGFDNFSAILGAVMSQGVEKSRAIKREAEV
jgi:DNA-binding response OmpR family regulator